MRFEASFRLNDSPARQARAGLWIAVALLTMTTPSAELPARAQYKGPLSEKDKKTSQLRAVGVLEWTGDPGKPKTSRLVPLTVYDGEQLQDGGLYLARPQPLAVDSGVEYVLQKDGARIGLFDIENSGQEQGSWVGFGVWKPMPAPKPPAPVTAAIEDEGSDRPVLHRKRSSGGSNGDDTGAKAPPPDPERPTLHKTPSRDDSDNTQTADDPDRPKLKKGAAKKPAPEEGYVENLPNALDPNRPKLQRGKSTGGVGPDVVPTPTLMGMPPDMQQTVAVSDSVNRPEHKWDFAWADPGDEQKMKSELEDIARSALGLQPPDPQAPSPPKTSKAKAHPVPTPEPAVPLVDEQFRVFELAYGSGATLVLTAHTDGDPKQQKCVTLVAQPDLYGNLLVLYKSLTDGSHLDVTPRMRLVDAVDAMADNRGELVFELRGDTQRQFALYRVLRGSAEPIFTTGPDTFALERRN